MAMSAAVSNPVGIMEIYQSNAWLASGKCAKKTRRIKPGCWYYIDLEILTGRNPGQRRCREQAQLRLSATPLLTD